MIWLKCLEGKSYKVVNAKPKFYFKPIIILNLDFFIIVLNINGYS